MRFSLIVATLGRTAELSVLLESLDRQTYRDFEIIVVDQNADNRLLPILSPFENRLQIRRLTSTPGLSHARNQGIKTVTGELVCFPDDDCVYAEDTLARVHEAFATNPPWSGVIGDSVDPAGLPTLPWRDREGKLSRPMCWRRSISYAIFLRCSVIGEIGGFDESLGVGAGTPWGSGEDSDLILRALQAGRHVQYDPRIRIYHPRLFPVLNEAGMTKRYNYARGDGKLLQKHPMPLWWDLLFFAVPIARIFRAALGLNRKEAYFHWLTFKGRLNGFLSARTPGETNVPFPLKSAPGVQIAERLCRNA